MCLPRVVVRITCGTGRALMVVTSHQWIVEMENGARVLVVGHT